MNRTEYIDSIQKWVISSTKGTGLFPSVMMAQAILESGNGNSELAKKYNNHFGIKANSSWKGQVINMKTGEYLEGNYTTITDGFRVYENPKNSFEDRVTFLEENPRYTKHGVFDAKSPVEQVQALQNAGYSTSPNYAKSLISIINANNLIALDVLQERNIRTQKIIIIAGSLLVIIVGGTIYYYQKIKK